MNFHEQLQRDRALRDAAWDVVSQDVNWLQADLDHRSVPARVVDHLGDRARDAAGKSLDVAKRNKLALGAAAVGIGLWLARRPLMDAAKDLWGRLTADEVENEEQADE